MQTRSEFTMAFTDTDASLAQVGGKGASLARLAIAGLPVPTGFYVTTDAYHHFVEKNGLQSRIMEFLRGKDFSDPATLESVSCSIRSDFIHGTFPAEIADAVSAAYSRLGSIPVAVRSSATAEDLPEASFAGQQETYLNICGIEAVLDSVKKCWASLWTARAIAYRAQHSISPESVALAVVVQELVFADAAGVMFTANPINGKRDEIMVTAAWGLGESIVSGAVTPDTLTVNKPAGKMIRRDIATKQVMTVRTESGTDEVPVPESKKKKSVLTDAQVVQLAKLGVKIEGLYRMPMDIEWTLAAGKFAIVQARPITALPAVLDWPLPHPKAVLARGSFAEFVPEPVSPLFATLAVPIARRESVKLMGTIGFEGEDSYLFSVLNDYVYVGFIFTPKMIWLMTKASFSMLGPIMRTARQRAVAAREKFLTTVQKWQAREPVSLTPSELLAGAREIFTETAAYYTMAQSGTIPTAMIREVFFSTYYDKLVKRKGDLEAAKFLFGTENHALRAEKALYDLAMWTREQPELAEYLTRTSAHEIGAALRTDPLPIPLPNEFAARFEQYLQQYGHAIYDLDFAKPTPADDPEPLIETLKVYLSRKNNPYERQEAALRQREEAVEAISKRLGPWLRRHFLNLLNQALDAAPLREDSIADLGLGHPQIRRMLGELGRRLAVEGAIACIDDVYWLEANEVDEMAVALEKGDTLKNFSKEVMDRKAKWEAMRHVTPPTTLPKISWMTRFFPSNEQTGDTIKGFAASAGRVTARACVMLGPEDFDKMQSGDVIVAGITTPAWTPLFVRASAIVTDIGGPLSHSSIVAREYGLPAVLATGIGTRRIHDGQWITVDGSAGIVELK